eukprot:4037127-Pyramimonas_sp.AAC.1
MGPPFHDRSAGGVCICLHPGLRQHLQRRRCTEIAPCRSQAISLGGRRGSLQIVNVPVEPCLPRAEQRRHLSLLRRALLPPAAAVSFAMGDFNVPAEGEGSYHADGIAHYPFDDV